MNKELAETIGELLQKQLGNKDDADRFRPASWQEGRSYLYPRTKFAVGDIVTMREDITKNYRFPKIGEKAVVTQVLDTPYRSGSATNHESAIQADFAIVMVDNEDGQIFEILFDSRHFEKVGSIYDPIHLSSGEILPVN